MVGTTNNAYIGGVWSQPMMQTVGVRAHRIGVRWVHIVEGRQEELVRLHEEEVCSTPHAQHGALWVGPGCAARRRWQ